MYRDLHEKLPPPGRNTVLLLMWILFQARIALACMYTAACVCMSICIYICIYLYIYIYTDICSEGAQHPAAVDVDHLTGADGPRMNIYVSMN